MADERELTCYCGLYCLDCIPSKTELYSTVSRLEELLARLQFHKYAEQKASQTYWSQANEAFKHYARFIEVLGAIRGLQCHTTCRNGGGYKGGRCEVRKCAVNRRLTGCWECSEYQTCQLLAPLLKFHPNLLYNLELIKAEGIENWARKRRGHYYWQ